MTTYALILAGGRGERLGDVRKAGLRIGGKTLLNSVAEKLSGLSILVSTGPGPSPGFGIGVEIADASDDFEGPMAGISAAVRHLRPSAGPDDLLLTVAVDTPFLPRDFAARMIASITEESNAAFAAWGDQIYPTNAIYRLDALNRRLADTPPRSPKFLLQSLGAAKVDWAGHEKADPFANLNTLADLIALGRRAGAAHK